jgi:hypothetical protein
MYGLAEDVDLRFLDGAVVQQVCIGENEVIFKFRGDICITVESRFLVSVGGVEAQFEDAPTSASHSVALLGERVTGTRIAGGGTLVLDMSGEKRLELYDSSPSYESYQISHGIETIVV